MLSGEVTVGEVKAVGVLGEFIKKDLDFELSCGKSPSEGSRYAFLFKTEEERKEFLQLITGIKRPLSGEVFINQKGLSKLSRDELLRIRSRIGVVFSGGGLINNLRVWENLVLPAIYHRIFPPEIIIEKGLNFLKDIDFKKEPYTRIADLTLLEKTLVGFGRALLMEPQILIFNAPFSGLRDGERDLLISFVNKMTSIGGEVTVGKVPAGLLIYIGDSPEEVELLFRDKGEIILWN